VSLTGLAVGVALAQPAAPGIETPPVIPAVGETSTHMCLVEAFVLQDGQEEPLEPRPCTMQFAPIALSRRDRVSVRTPSDAEGVTLGSTTGRARSCSQRGARRWSCPALDVPASASNALVTIRFPGGRTSWSFDVWVLPYGQRGRDERTGLSFWLTRKHLRVSLPAGQAQRPHVPQLRGRLTATCVTDGSPHARGVVAKLRLTRAVRSAWFEFRRKLPGPASACSLERTGNGRDIAAVSFNRP
jgi:hypothetical protein